MANTTHLMKILRVNMYDTEARKRLMEIGSISDLEWLYERYPTDDVRKLILQKGNARSLMKILTENMYDTEAIERLMEIGSISDLEWLYDLNPTDDIRKAIINYEPPLKKNIDKSHNKSIQMTVPSKTTNKSFHKTFDVFICHASEDKKDFVDSLARALKGDNIKVWYDDFVLEWGDSLRESIDKGLVNSRYGIVVFSKAFLSKKKKWTKHELDGLFAKEIDGKKVILPIWHNISREELLQYSPAFADRLAKNSQFDSIEDIVKCVKRLLEKK